MQELVRATGIPANLTQAAETPVPTQSGNCHAIAAPAPAPAGNLPLKAQELTATVRRWMTGATALDDRRSTLNAQGPVALRVAELTHATIETPISNVMRVISVARDRVSANTRAFVGHTLRVAKLGAASALVAASLAAGVTTASFAQEFPTTQGAAVSSALQVPSIGKLVSSFKDAKDSQHVYVVGNVVGQELEQLELYLKERAPHVTVVAIDHADRTVPQLEELVRDIGRTDLFQARHDAGTGESDGVILLVAYGNATDPNQRSVSWHAGELYKKRGFAKNDDIIETFRGVDATATLDQRVRNVLERTSRTINSALAQEARAAEVSKSAPAGGDSDYSLLIGLLAAGVFSLAALVAIRHGTRSASGPTSRERTDKALGKLDAQLTPRLEKLTKVLKDAETYLGASPTEARGRFAPKTLDVVEQLIGDIRSLFVLHGVPFEIGSAVNALITPKPGTKRFWGKVAEANYEQALQLLSSELAFDPAKGLSIIADGDLGSKAWKEAIVEDLRSVPAVSGSVDVLVAAFDQVARKLALKLDKVKTPVDRLNAQLAEIEPTPQVIAAHVERLAKAAANDGLFALPSLMPGLTPLVDTLVAEARTLRDTDPVSAGDVTPADEAEALLSRAAKLIGVCDYARDTVRPRLDAAAATLATHGTDPAWISRELSELSARADEHAKDLVSDEAHKLRQAFGLDLQSLLDRAESALEVDGQRRELESRIPVATAEVAAALIELVKTPGIDPKMALREPGSDPHVTLAAATKHVADAQTHIAAGEIELARRELTAATDCITAAAKLVEVAQTVVRDFAARRIAIADDIKELRGQVVERLAALRALRETYADEALPEDYANLEANIERALQEAAEQSAEAAILFREGKLVAASRGLDRGDRQLNTADASSASVADAAANLAGANRRNAEAFVAGSEEARAAVASVEHRGKNDVLAGRVLQAADAFAAFANRLEAVPRDPVQLGRELDGLGAAVARALLAARPKPTPVRTSSSSSSYGTRSASPKKSSASSGSSGHRLTGDGGWAATQAAVQIATQPSYSAPTFSAPTIDVSTNNF